MTPKLRYDTHTISINKGTFWMPKIKPHKSISSISNDSLNTASIYMSEIQQLSPKPRGIVWNRSIPRLQLLPMTFEFNPFNLFFISFVGGSSFFFLFLSCKTSKYLSFWIDFFLFFILNSYGVMSTFPLY
ncbi:hypothetical protein ACH5RR_027879 [Cinchona calisaya]|uniref:Uncharacterized protein n=1 Tax=Cinchona calisaya TaxID=153742 RepID=A0ABD2YNC7_9GENT